KESEYCPTPLSWTAENINEPIAKLLPDKGAEVCSNGHENRMPLSWSALNGLEVIVELLIDKGLG
ncbi:hypothetical protein M441DRAFT_154527, partial [Trichoderma asperellum CBS 433.97]